jgi:hypothetical protein
MVSQASSHFANLHIKPHLPSALTMCIPLFLNQSRKVMGQAELVLILLNSSGSHGLIGIQS